MKKRILLIFFLSVCTVVFAQQNRTTRLYEYRPAPGQFINTPQLGIPDAALQITTSVNHLVSLGAFGGSITLGFENAVLNRPDNPYGIDFTVFGNAFNGSSEPGIIWVMKDENRNGLPDETWYQIAGSEYFNPLTRQNYQIKWRKLPDGSAEWNDSENSSGTITKNEFHSQPYYPQSCYFGNYPADSVILKGTLLVYHPVVTSEQTMLPALAFGYADNGSINRDVASNVPDNPYTPDIQEGAGGDPVDISWAVDSLGRYVDLDQIDFIRIVTGVNGYTDQLGEISTEVGFAVATEPGKNITGPDETVVIHSHPASMYIGDTLTFSTGYFKKGRIADRKIKFETSDISRAIFLPDGKLAALKGGKVKIKASPEGLPEIQANTEIVILIPDSIACPELSQVISAGQTLKCIPKLTDQYGLEITGMQWNVSVSDTSVLRSEIVQGGFNLKGVRNGSATLRIWTSRFPQKIRTTKIMVSENDYPVRIYVSVKSAERNILPSQWIEIRKISLTDYIENRTGDYNTSDFVSLAQAVVTTLKKAGVNFNLKENTLPGLGLFLYSIEQSGAFTYGWGGKTDPSAYARCWVIRKNGLNFLNSLDKTIVSNGDSIIIYHVNNILKEWDLDLLTATPDSIYQGDLVEVETKIIRCSFSLLSGIKESSALPLASQPVFIGDKFSETTNSAGRAVLTIAGKPPVTICSGNNAVLIYDKTTTGLAQIRENEIEIFPNPACDFIKISGLTGRKSTLQIFDLSGKKTMETLVESKDIPISIRSLRERIYIIVIQDDKKILHCKFIKK
jgi:Secretion system C-terminal sorting domain